MMKRLEFVAVAALVAVSCAPRDEGQPDAPEDVIVPGVVDVVARDLTLDAPDEIPSGWTTFRFTNQSPMVHFVLVERLPDGEGVESQQAEVAPVFQNDLDLLAAGDVEAALQRFGDLPAWFGEIVFLGGPGLTSPGRTSEATVFLEPGTYLLECYVKTDGVFHSYNADPETNGMVHEFTVTAETSEAVEPSPTVQIEISSTGGIEVQGALVAGEQTVAVRFLDQTVHENFVGHDIHLVRVAPELDIGALESWMDWTLPGGLQTPAPAQFLGGLNEMPAGTTGYFTVVLEAGDYAWVSEVPGSVQKGMLKRFTLAPGQGG